MLLAKERPQAEAFPHLFRNIASDLIYFVLFQLYPAPSKTRRRTSCPPATSNVTTGPQRGFPDRPLDFALSYLVKKE